MCGGYGVYVVVYCVVGVGGLFDGNCDDDYWVVEFCWIDGVVYCVDVWFLLDDVVYGYFGVGRGCFIGFC